MNNSNNKRLQKIREDLNSAWNKLKLDDKLAEIATLEAEVGQPELWLDLDNARTKNSALAHLSDEVQPWRMLRMQVDDLDELLNLNDDTLASELSVQIQSIE